MKLDINDTAILIWMPRGVFPDPEHYRVDAFGALGATLVHQKMFPRPGEEPWIKVAGAAGAVLSPVQVLKAYENYKNDQDINA